MKRKPVLMVVAILLLAGALVLVMRGEPAASAAGAGAAHPATGALRSGGAAGGEPVRLAPRASRAQQNKPDAIDKLVAEYGAERVEFARQLTGKLAVSMEALADTIEKNIGTKAARNVRRYIAPIELDAGKQAQLDALVDDFQRRRAAELRKALERLRDKPEPLMRLLLMGERAPFTKEYGEVEQDAQIQLRGLLHPTLVGNEFGGDPRSDAVFRRGFLKLLDADQLAAWRASPLSREPDPNTGMLAISLSMHSLQELDRMVTPGQDGAAAPTPSGVPANRP